MEAQEAVFSSLRRLALIGMDERPALTPMSGGVSCDVFRADLSGGPVCVKRALPRLRVAKEWTAPVERAEYEVGWLKIAADVGIGAPTVIAHDAEAHLFVMNYLPPEAHPVWKAELAAGRVDPGFAAAVGRNIARVHAATAYDDEVATRFDTRALFNALRVEPFLLTTAAAHPEIGGALRDLAARTLDARIALAHGDVSPKNILVGPEGPVILDAECAWFGDPAFDLAFVSTHLLLKTLWKPPHAAAYLAALAALWDAYFALADWEPQAALQARAAALLPALLLARVDGKSPAEYLNHHDHAFIRAFAPSLIAAPPANTGAVAAAWRTALERR